MRGLYAIYDHPHRSGLDAREVIRALLAAGVRDVQLRAKSLSTAQRLEILRSISPLCLDAAARLWINDDCEAALALGSGVVGVHLGQEDLPGQPAGWRDQLREVGLGFGISTHDLDQVRAAVALEPDYLGFGPVFPTTGKDAPDPVVGLETLARACASSRFPVVAIGGIDEGRVGACLAAGAGAVAVIGALIAEDVEGVEAKARALVAACHRALAPPSADASDFEV